jgi:serine/threonine protein kinase
MNTTKTRKHTKNPKVTVTEKISQKKQFGGKKLGQGSYGCVVNPPLKCLNKQLLRNNDFQYSNNYISKIIKTKYSDVAFSELNMGSKIYKLDSNHNFFVPFINACYFTPQKHPDIVYLSSDGKLISSNPDSFDSSESTYLSDIEFKTDISSHLLKEHKSKCVLKNNNDYLNLIGPIAGDNLSNILINNKNIKKINFIKNNYWYIYSYLVKGLSILHKKKIIHKDIKPSNLIVDFRYFNTGWNVTKKSGNNYSSSSLHSSQSSISSTSSRSLLSYSIINCRIRYIDFGLSLHLNKKKYSVDEIISLLADGTTYYTPIDIFGIKLLYRLIKRGYNPESKDFLNLMMNKLAKKYQANRNYYHSEGIRNNYFSFEGDSIYDTKNYYLTASKYETSLKYILNLYNSNKLNDKIPDFLYGWDIYSLGIVLAKIAIRSDVKNIEFKNIIFKMIELNPEKRLNVSELIKVPEFVNVLSGYKSIKINYKSI